MFVGDTNLVDTIKNVVSDKDVLSGLWKIPGAAEAATNAVNNINAA